MKLPLPSFSVSPGVRPRHVVVDATGLKVYGSGEWHVRKHRSGRQRTWRKFHLGTNETMKEIMAVEVATSRVHDSRPLPRLLSQIQGRIGQISGATGPMTQEPVTNRYLTGRLSPPSLRDEVHG